MSDGTDKAEYVFTGSYKRTDAAIVKMTINSDVVVLQPEISEVSSNKAKIVIYKRQVQAMNNYRWFQSLRFLQVLLCIIKMNLMLKVQQ